MALIRMAVDNRETASGIPEILRRKGIYVEMRNLDVGDYVVSDIAVERKTPRDFIISLYSGRLFDQVGRLSEAYRNILLIVEGDVQEILSDIKNPRAYWGSLLTLGLEFDFKIFFTLDQDQTAELLYLLAKRLESGGRRTRPILVKKPRLATVKARQISVIGALPSIGPKLAERLLTSFGSVRKVFLASKMELAVKGGVGRSRAEKIQDLLDATYTHRAAAQSKLT